MSPLAECLQESDVATHDVDLAIGSTDAQQLLEGQVLENLDEHAVVVAFDFLEASKKFFILLRVLVQLKFFIQGQYVLDRRLGVKPASYRRLQVFLHHFLIVTLGFLDSIV